MIVLSKEQILMMHNQLIKETGGSYGIKDDGLLESALGAPFQSFDGKDFFPSVYHKAARLGYGLAVNHAFVDGNKRIGAHAMLAFLSLNGICLNYTQEELIKLFLNIASGKNGYADVFNWIINHII